MAELIMQEESSTPSTPSSGKWKAYFKSNGWYIVEDSGREIGPLAASDGWNPGTGTWSYTSADSPSFVASVPDADAALLQLGDRIKLTQTTAKYFIVTKIGTPSGGFTPVTIYGGTDYTLANAAITLPFWSHAKSPLGFPMDRIKWTVLVSSSSDCTKTSPSASTWYGGAGLSATGPSIDIPIGSWKVNYKAALNLTLTLAAAASVGFRATLSTANNSESDSIFTFSATLVAPIITGGTLRQTAQVPQKTLNLTSKTTYYLNLFTGAASMTDVSFLGSSTFATLIMAECAYL